MVKAWHRKPARPNSRHTTFSSAPFSLVYLVPEIVKFLKLAKLLVVLLVPLVGVMTSPAFPNVWVQPLSPASETKYFWPFFFNDTATTEISPLSLHDALPISVVSASVASCTPLLLASVKL